MNIQELTDEELNRAMVWLNPPACGIFNDCERSGIWGDSYGEYTDHLDYLTDWSLTGPLVHKYCITLDTYNPANEGQVSSWFCSQYGNHETDLSDNPLRAICECVLMMRMKK